MICVFLEILGHRSTCRKDTWYFFVHFMYLAQTVFHHTEFTPARFCVEDDSHQAGWGRKVQVWVNWHGARPLRPLLLPKPSHTWKHLILVWPTWSADMSSKISSNLRTFSDQTKKLMFFPPPLHIQIVAQHKVSHGSSNTLHGGCASTEQARCVGHTVNLFVLFFCLFFLLPPLLLLTPRSLAKVQMQQTVVQTVTDCLETMLGCPESCLTTADTININTLAHTNSDS